MTVVSNDPVWWPTISFYREVSYYQGSWRTRAVTQSLMVTAQLHPSSWCYTIGVREIMLTEEIIDVSYSSALMFGQEVG